MMIKPEDFTGTNYFVIEGVVDKGNKISIKYKEEYCKTIKTLVIKFDEEGYIMSEYCKNCYEMRGSEEIRKDKKNENLETKTI